MNRTDRLYALVEELRSRAPRMMRAAELAERFAVSTRTIERDLLALQQAGVPIWAQPGPGGGYNLNVETTLPPLNLTPAEAAAIATALAATRSMPFAEAGRSALLKLTGVMAAGSKDTASRLIDLVRIAQPAGDPPVSAVSDTLQRALLDSVAVELTYRDGQGARNGAHRRTRRPLRHPQWLVPGRLVPSPPGIPRLPPRPHRPGYPHRRADHAPLLRCHAPRAAV